MLREDIKLKNIRFIPILLICYLLCCGYTFGEKSPYINVNCSLGNNIDIYFPVDKIEYLEIKDNEVINNSSGTIYGYTENNRISFPVYELPYYNINYNSVELNISVINEVNFYTSTADMINKQPLFYLVLLVGGVFIWLILTLH